MWGQTEAYMLASRDAAQTMDRLLAADLERMRPAPPTAGTRAAGTRSSARRGRRRRLTWINAASS